MGGERDQASTSREEVRGIIIGRIGRTKLYRSRVWVQPIFYPHLEGGTRAEARDGAPPGVSLGKLGGKQLPTLPPDSEVLFRI